MKGKRIINYRPICFFALALAAGILVGEALFGEKAMWLILPLLAAVICFILLAAFKNVRKLIYIPIAFVIGVCSVTVSNQVYSMRIIDELEGTIYCRVASEIIVEDSTAKFYVTDISIEGKKVDYDAIVYQYQYNWEPNFNAGDRIYIRGKLEGNKHRKFGSDYDTRRVDYVCNRIVAEYSTKIGEGQLPFPYNLKHNIMKMLYQNMREDTADIAQALVLGDKFGLDEVTYALIKDSGLAHVLAVSGLHMTTLSAALYFLLKKLKVKPKISFLIVMALSIFYSMLCGFSSSSLRAVIMGGIFNFTSSFGRKRDGLSALSLAAIAILTFRPNSLMSAGFLLSFFSMLGLFVFYSPLRRLGMKIVDKISPKRHFGKRFVDVAAASISTNLMVYPIVAHFFGRVPVLFIISNFFMLPYIMAVYVILIILILFALITTLTQVLWLGSWLLVPFIAFVTAIGVLPFAAVNVGISVVGIVGFYATTMTLSPHIMLKRATRVRAFIICLSATLFICFAIVLKNSMPWIEASKVIAYI